MGENNNTIFSEVQISLNGMSTYLHSSLERTHRILWVRGFIPSMSNGLRTSPMRSIFREREGRLEIHQSRPEHGMMCLETYIVEPPSLYLAVAQIRPFRAIVFKPIGLGLGTSENKL
jgi:hypothetical protein